MFSEHRKVFRTLTLADAGAVKDSRDNTEDMEETAREADLPIRELVNVIQEPGMEETAAMEVTGETELAEAWVVPAVISRSSR